MDEQPVLDQFDEDHLSEAAEAAEVDRERLIDAAIRHQAAMRDLPGVENLMYEWRKQHEGARIGRTDEAYYAMVPERVWEEFADAIDASGAVQAALRGVHERQTRTTLDRDGPPEGQTYVVLIRPA